MQLTLTGGYSDSSVQNLTNVATWISTNPAVATVSSGGLVTAVGPGYTTVSGGAGGASAMSVLVTVSGSATPGGPH